MEYDKTVIAKRIKSLRSRKGYSQDDLARATEKTKATVQNWEYAKDVPDRDSLIAMADAFGVSERWILGLVNNEPFTAELEAWASKRSYATPEAVKWIGSIPLANKPTDETFDLLYVAYRMDLSREEASLAAMATPTKPQ